MAGFDSHWQQQQAAEHEQGLKQNWFAAAFHWGQLALHHPSHLSYWQKLETACAHWGDYQPALAVCDRLLRQHPGLAPIYFQRARFLAHRFQFHAATADHLAGLALVGLHPLGWPEFAKELPWLAIGLPCSRTGSAPSGRLPRRSSGNDKTLRIVSAWPGRGWR